MKFIFNPIQGGGRGNRSPTSFPSLTTTNVGISPQNLSSFSPNLFASLVEMIELPNFCHMTACRMYFESSNKILLVKSRYDVTNWHKDSQRPFYFPLSGKVKVSMKYIVVLFIGHFNAVKFIKFRENI